MNNFYDDWISRKEYWFCQNDENDKYLSDKSPQIFHSYSPEYFNLLKNIKYTAKNILEIGIGNKQLMESISGPDYIHGASLKAWKDFFPNANIYGLDIDNSTLFQEERIKCFYTDQSKETELEKSINEIQKDNQNQKFDLIIDDGSHYEDHMILTFFYLHKYLNTNGIYIIEDIKFHEIPRFAALKINEISCEIIKIHQGEGYWDGFIAYKKI